jgi:hypothetical protein
MLLTLDSTPEDDESCASTAAAPGSEVPSVLSAAGSLAGLDSLGIGMSNGRANRREPPDGLGSRGRIKAITLAGYGKLVRLLEYSRSVGRLTQR